MSRTKHTGLDWMRWIARAIVTVWACWWTFFALAEEISEGHGRQSILPGIVAVLMFLGSAFLAWRWKAASILLIVEGLLVCMAYPIGFLHARSVDTLTFVLLTLAAPPLVSGLLLYGSWTERERPKA